MFFTSARISLSDASVCNSIEINPSGIRPDRRLSVGEPLVNEKGADARHLASGGDAEPDAPAALKIRAQRGGGRRFRLDWLGGGWRGKGCRGFGLLLRHLHHPGRRRGALGQCSEFRGEASENCLWLGSLPVLGRGPNLLAESVGASKKQIHQLGV